MNDEITNGADILGALIMGHPFKSWWWAADLSIEESRRLVPHQNATTMQVAISVVAAAMWMIENPDRGREGAGRPPARLRPRASQAVSRQLHLHPLGLDSAARLHRTRSAASTSRTSTKRIRGNSRTSWSRTAIERGVGGRREDADRTPAPDRHRTGNPKMITQSRTAEARPRARNPPFVVDHDLRQELQRVQEVPAARPGLFRRQGEPAAGDRAHPLQGGRELRRGLDARVQHRLREHQGHGAKKRQDWIWDKIIYANPNKPVETLAELDQYKPLVTFDNAEELRKIREHAPQAGVALRIKVANTGAMVELSSKFGAAPGEAVDLILLADEAGAHLRGPELPCGQPDHQFRQLRAGARASARASSRRRRTAGTTR